MTVLRDSGLVAAFAMTTIITLVASADAQAQKKTAPAAGPTAPTLTTAQSLGAKRGGTVELTLTGTNLLDATGIWTSFGGKVTIPEGQTDATKLRAAIEIPADVPVGLHTFRVATSTGISNLKPLSVDDWPEVVEKPGNNKKESPQIVTTPCVITGTATAEMSDFYKFAVKAGDSITIEAIARRIGSPLDPVIVVYDGGGREIPGLYADDTPGLQTDTRVVHTFPSVGEAIVEIRDTTYRGGADYTYRLRIGTCPGATTAFPLFVEQGKTTQVGFAGPHVDGVKPVAVTPAANASVVSVSPRFEAGGAGWAVPVRVSSHPEIIEQEPNNEPATANKIPVPGGVSARFAEKNDLDHFSFTAKKGQKLLVQVLTHEVNSPAEVYLRILDGKGIEVAKSNPQLATPRIEFAPLADGEYVIACEQTNFVAGPNEIYHLSVRPHQPEVVVTVGTDRLDIPVGGTNRLPIVGVTRPTGFTAPIEVTFVGAEGVSGQLTIPGSANPQPNNPLFVPLTVKPGTKLGPLVGTLEATIKLDAATVTSPGSVFEIARTAFAGLPNPPHELTTQIAIAVTLEPPYSLALTFEKSEVLKGGTLKGKLTAKRMGNFNEEIVVSAGTLPASAKPTFKPIAKGSNEVEIVIEVPGGVPTGPTAIVLRGVARVAGKDISVLSPPVNVTIQDAKKK